MSEPDWRMLVALLNFLESNWEEPDEGIWEVRGKPQHFTHSKVMAWVAFDRAVKLVEDCGCAANDHLETWKDLRDQIHARGLRARLSRGEESVHPDLWFRRAGRESPHDPAGRISSGHRRAGPKHDRRDRTGAAARRVRLALSA